MFTGIVKAVGRITRMESRGGDLRLTISADGLPWQEYAQGESIAVNGVCLTAVAFHDDGFDADVSGETLRVTALAHLASGSKVNLEPSVSVGERLGGHLVSGHVDCVGRIRTREAAARSVRLVVEHPAEYGRFIAKKGSVCVDGVSLTVNEVSTNAFEVNIIPHTAEATIVTGYRSGTEVNIEVDVVARYLERLLGHDKSSPLNEAFLKAHGYG